MSGYELSDILFDKYGIEDELANEKSVLFLTGLGTSKSKLRKLEKALTEITADNIRISQDYYKDIKSFVPVEPRIRYIPALMWGKPSREVELKYALSRVCNEVVAD